METYFLKKKCDRYISFEASIRHFNYNDQLDWAKTEF